MKLGIAIPCYKYYIPKLLNLLENINQQTRLPDQVVVSCSSVEDHEFPVLPSYSYPVKVLLHKERKNAAENRNLASKALDTDIISFFDADDIMHPQRLEAVSQAFLGNAKIFLHSYFGEGEHHVSFKHIDNFEIHINDLMRAPSGCAQVISHPSWRIHHSQVSVQKDVLSQVQFPEGNEYERREDAVFCGWVLARPEIQSSYCEIALSKYYPEGIWY